jgi:hypothetical protein
MMLLWVSAGDSEQVTCELARARFEHSCKTDCSGETAYNHLRSEEHVGVAPKSVS